VTLIKFEASLLSLERYKYFTHIWYTGRSLQAPTSNTTHFLIMGPPLVYGTGEDRHFKSCT